MNEFRVSSTHPEDLADGRVLGPGESASNVDEKDPHNRRLISEGKLVKVGGTDAPEVTEAARRKASELGVSLADVTGSGADGQIIVKDVEDAADNDDNDNDGGD